MDSVIPLAGTVLSNMLFLSPASAVLRVQAERELGELNPTPLVLMLLSTVLWTSYGIAIANPFVVVSNAFGIVLSTWYIVAVLPHMGKDARAPVVVRAVTAGAGLVVLELCAVNLAMGPQGRAKALGFSANVACVLLFASPLSTMQEVISTADSSSILTPLTVVQVANCSLWLAYGAIIGDPWIWGPNTPGTAFGLCQLALKLRYPSQTPVTPPKMVARASADSEMVRLVPSA